VGVASIPAHRHDARDRATRPARQGHLTAWTRLT